VPEREREENIALKIDGQKLRGMIHLPHGKELFPAVALFHGWSGQRMESHFIFVKLARLLAKNKIVAARFDFRGSGESDGEFENMTISQEIEDGMEIMHFLAGHSLVNNNRLGIVGLSLGGYVAQRMAVKRNDISCLALWSTIADVREVLQSGQMFEKLKEELNKKGYADINGLKLKKNFFIDLSQTKKIEASSHQGKVLIIHGTEDKNIPLKFAYQLKKIFPCSRLKKIEGADHVFSQVEWEEEVLRETVNFLKDEL